MEKKQMFRTALLLAAVFVLCFGFQIQRVHAAGVSTNEKAVVTSKKYSDHYRRPGAKVDASYSYRLLQLKGNTKAVKKINAELKKDYRNSLKSKKQVFAYAKEAGDYYTQTYYETVSAKAVYNKNGYLSILFHESNFAGGPHGYLHGYAMTFDLKTGKRLVVSDVVEGSQKEVKNKIAKKCLDQMRAGGYFGSDIWADPEKAAKDFLDQTPVSKYNFYLKNGRVVVFFNQYDLGMSYAAGIAPHVVLKGNYE